MNEAGVFMICVVYRWVIGTFSARLEPGRRDEQRVIVALLLVT